MVNASEEILNAFSENYFYKEVIISDLRYKPNGQTEQELADILFTVGPYVLAIQLKERNKCDQTYYLKDEEKWLIKKCKQAKAQVEKTIINIGKGDLPIFVNNRGQSVTIDRNSKVIPIVMFMNPTIKEYNLVLQKHSDEGYDINCISFEDFCEVCKTLVTPIEIVEYFEWRQDKFKNSPQVQYLFFEDEDGISFAEPMKSESATAVFLHERYGINAVSENIDYLDSFRYMLSNLKERTIVETEKNSSLIMINFFATLNRCEIKELVGRLQKTIVLSKEGHSPAVTGSMRNIQSNYTIFFIASNGEFLSIDYLVEESKKKQKVNTVVEIVIYWVSNVDYRIDYLVHIEN